MSKQVMWSVWMLDVWSCPVPTGWVHYWTAPITGTFPWPSFQGFLFFLPHLYLLSSHLSTLVPADIMGGGTGEGAGLWTPSYRLARSLWGRRALPLGDNGELVLSPSSLGNWLHTESYSSWYLGLQFYHCKCKAKRCTEVETWGRVLVKQFSNSSPLSFCCWGIIRLTGHQGFNGWFQFPNHSLISELYFSHCGVSQFPWAPAMLAFLI